MKALLWLDENLEKVICVLLLSSMTGIIFLQFVMRRVFNNSLVWSEELARYMFIWLVFIGISYGAKLIRHIKLEAVVEKMPAKARPYFYLLGDLMFLYYVLYILYVSIEVVQMQMRINQTSPAMGIPFAVVYAAPTVGFALTAIRQVQVIIPSVKKLISAKGGEVNG